MNPTFETATMHTPGPWRVVEADVEGLEFYILPSGEAPAIVSGLMERCARSRDESRANAALIAAAPDLQAALRVCETVLGESAGESHNVVRELTDVELGKLWISCIEQVRAALAKAKGQLHE